jgi:predicted RNA-binding protein
MCEFKVITPHGEIAREITYATIEGKAVLLKDVLGATTRAENMIITEVDVGRETLTLEEAPIIASLLSFLSAWRESLSRGSYDESIESYWEDVKAQGDAMVRLLWSKTRSRPD